LLLGLRKMICFTMPAFSDRIRHALASREQSGLTRRLMPLSAGNRLELECNGDKFVNFSSNDYLGLACAPELSKAWQEGIALYGNGSGASPLVTGFSSAHQNLEAALCEWLGFERAILFSSGFSANQALLFGLLEKGDLLIQDKLNHASLMEAGMLSPATMTRFKHNDVESLKKRLTSDALVVTEGVFSMDGDCAPLKQIRDVTNGKAWLAVDDAHGVGVLGADGRGSCSEVGIKPELLVVTFGKAFGLSGAAVLCSHEVGDYLTQFSRHHVYSTAMPPAQAYALTYALNMIQTEQWRRDKLLELQDYYAECFSSFTGYVETRTPIKPLVLGDAERSMAVAAELNRSGAWLAAIRPPTVPKGSARLRITLTANHDKSQVEWLAKHLYKALEKVG